MKIGSEILSIREAIAIVATGATTRAMTGTA
jgi:hypothetical protein